MGGIAKMRDVEETNSKVDLVGDFVSAESDDDGDDEEIFMTSLCL